MKKKTIAALIAALTITSLTACGGPDQLSKSVTVELGDEEGIKVTDILDISKDEAKDAKLDTKDVDFYKEGSYDAKLTYNKKDYTVKVKIKDTTAPEVTAKENIGVQPGTPVRVTDCIATLLEKSGRVDAEFKEKPESTSDTEGTETVNDTESDKDTSNMYAIGDVDLNENDEVVYDTVGDYDNDIVITDEAGNESTVAVKITVLDEPVLNGVADKTVAVGETIDYMSGVTATDGKGEDITSSVEVDSSSVDTNTVGDYKVTYKVTDKYGLTNRTVVTFSVKDQTSEPEQVADSDNGSSDSGSSDTESGKSNSSKKNSSKGNSGSSNSSGSAASSGNNSSGSSSSSGESSSGSQSSNPKAGVAETFFDGSLSSGIIAEEKAHIDGIVQKWLSGGCSGDAAENEAINYLIDRGYNVSSSGSEKDSRILIPSNNPYTLKGCSTNGYYYYGKLYTNGEVDSEYRVGYMTSFNIN